MKADTEYILTDAEIKEIVTIAAEEAIKEYKSAARNDRIAEYERRINATRELLRNYKKYIEVAQAAPELNQEQMAHVERMLTVYKNLCLRSSKQEARRRWRVIELTHLTDPEHTHKEVAQIVYCSTRTIDFDLQNAYRELSDLFFGIDFQMLLSE